MNTRLFLMRHGETVSNINLIYQGKGDSPLTELGREEAGQLGAALANEKFAAIYSSGLTRSLETARIIGEKCKISAITKVPDLNERDYGIFEGLGFEEIRRQYSELYELWITHPYKASIPEAETLDKFQARCVLAIQKIVASHPGQNICVVGHGGTNRCILFHYMNLALENFWRIKQDNCCINTIEFDRHPKVTLLNSTWFLGEKRVSRTGIY